MLLRLARTGALAVGLYTPAAMAAECYTPLIELVPIVVGVDGAEPPEEKPTPFDNKADYEVVLKGTSCENSFTTPAGTEVTFGWEKLRPEEAKTLTFTVVGPRPFVIKNRETVVLPAGTWTLRIERPAPKVGRLADLTFTLRTRFKGVIQP